MFEVSEPGTHKGCPYGYILYLQPAFLLIRAYLTLLSPYLDTHGRGKQRPYEASDSRWAGVAETS